VRERSVHLNVVRTKQENIRCKVVTFGRAGEPLQQKSTRACALLAKRPWNSINDFEASSLLDTFAGRVCLSGVQRKPRLALKTKAF
jgi:hypothetical protein